ncbi:hypothetical protein BRADI_5g03659v3 [Brachypodium distachyon]|uniref:CG-1 domain-containing protein n=1 Tax=Brachypodium distachyon TaxID=15368 RepID=A0A2K2CFB9_BRADI|nr:hypothetical protein BRADI_5g03659v3 [Brachypodium distachyon]
MQPTCLHRLLALVVRSSSSMPHVSSPPLGSDTNMLLKEARSRWLKPSEVYSILLNHECLLSHP